MASGSAKRAITGVVIISAVSTGWSNLTIQAQGIAEIPADSAENDLGFKMALLEE
jgi:hypothetical protein